VKDKHLFTITINRFTSSICQPSPLTASHQAFAHHHHQQLHIEHLITINSFIAVIF
jgi:hypothetical protein